MSSTHLRPSPLCLPSPPPFHSQLIILPQGKEKPEWKLSQLVLPNLQTYFIGAHSWAFPPFKGKDDLCWIPSHSCFLGSLLLHLSVAFSY
jgi:hypothetical protein